MLLGKLARINRPLQIGFSDMLKLMQQCNRVERQREFSKRRQPTFEALYERDSNDVKNERDFDYQSDAPAAANDESNRGILSGNPFSLLSGVFPGTKWCGTGDIAKNFHDLGQVSFYERRENFLTHLTNLCLFVIRRKQPIGVVEITIYVQSKFELIRHGTTLQTTQFSEY